MLFLAMLAPVFLFADSAELPPLLVTAGRRSEERDRSPRRIEIRDELDLQLGRMPRSLPEALRETPSVMIQKTGHGQGSPYLRGWTGFRTLMMIDGVRLNNSTFRDGPNQYWSTIDTLSLRQLELVLGPGSVLYGSDAIGGTVQVFTSDPLARADAGERGRAYVRGATAERAGFTRIESVSPLGENAAAQTGVTYKNHGNLRSGDGRQPGTAYREWGADAKVAGRNPAGDRWTFAFQEYRILDAPRTHRTRDAVPFNGTDTGTDRRLDFDQGRSLIYGLWEQPEPSGPFRDLRLQISWHQQREDQIRVRETGRRDESGFQVDTPGISLQGALGDPDRTWILGTDTYYDRVSSYGRVFPDPDAPPQRQIQGPVGDEATYLTTGAFLRHLRTLAPHTVADLGLRGEYSRARVDRFRNPQTGEPDSLNSDWTSLVSSLHLRRDLTDTLQLHGGVAQGFRAPNLSDLTSLGVARSGEVELPTPSLDPETFLNYELGLRRHRGTLRGELTFWYTDARDLITRRPTGETLGGEPAVTKTNAASGHLRGVEATLEWEPHTAWRFWTAASWQTGTVDSFPGPEPVITREPFSRLMPLTVHLGARHWLREHLWTELVVTHAEKADKLSAGDRRDTQRIPPGGTPGYTVAHLRFGMEVSPGLHISLAVENLLDENYRVHGSGLNEPGRNLVLALDKRF